MSNDNTKKQLQVAHNKKILLEALEKTCGVVTSACNAAGISRTTFYSYVRSDSEFAKSFAEMTEIALDFAESSLYRQIEANVPASTIFYLKTKGRSRGYIEKQEIEHTVNDPVNLAKITVEQTLDKLRRRGDITQEIMDEVIGYAVEEYGVRADQLIG